MFRLKNSSFDLLFEDVYTRFQSGGLLSGDIVTFRSNAMNHPAIKGATQDFQNMIRELMESDLNLKVGAIRTIRPGQQYHEQNTIYGFSVDIVQEYAPGLFRLPVTVPIEILERVDGTGTYRNPQPVPDSFRRKDRVNIEPEEIKVKKQDPVKGLTDTVDPERNIRG